MEADPDAELMLRLKNGEDWILNELMTRWQQPLVAFIYRYIGRETEALDLAQETFVRVYATRHRYAVRGKFSTWLFTIAANLCRNYLRWRQRRGESASETWDTEDAKPAESLQSLEDSRSSGNEIRIDFSHQSSHRQTPARPKNSYPTL
jgi:RNA polymerase sigma factor (sigma-70 family)